MEPTRLFPSIVLFSAGARCRTCSHLSTGRSHNRRNHDRPYMDRRDPFR